MANIVPPPPHPPPPPPTLASTQQQYSLPPIQPHPQPQHNLLNLLSGELRNKIYRYALLSPTDIPVTSTGYPIASGLLSTNHQIRREARTIFYVENTFLLDIHSFNSKPIIHWLTHLNNFLPREMGLRIHFVLHSNEVCWGNLLEWLERVYKGECIPCCGLRKLGMGRRVDLSLVDGLFEMVGRLRGVVCWGVVRGLVEVQRGSLVLVDGRWGRD